MALHRSLNAKISKTDTVRQIDASTGVGTGGVQQLRTADCRQCIGCSGKTGGGSHLGVRIGTTRVPRFEIRGGPQLDILISAGGCDFLN